jgi:hypothetical protein
MKIFGQGKIFFLSTLVVMFLLASCQDKSQMLIKTWKLQDFKYNTQVPKGLRETIDKSLDAMKDRFTLTYNADGTYISQIDSNELHGTWKLNANSSAITSTTDKGDKKDYKIIQLDEGHFNFEVTEGKSTVIFVMVPAGKQ